MKKFFSYVAFSLTLALGFMASSCTTDLCKDVDCGTNGKCDEVDGKCICDAGYQLGTTSKKCDTEMRAKFVGTWRGMDCGSTTSHSIIITNNSGSISKVNISNWSNVDCSTSNPVVAVASVSTDGSKLETFTTDCPTANGYTLGSTGNTVTLDAAGTTMTAAYNCTVGGTPYTCTLTYTKQ